MLMKKMKKGFAILLAVSLIASPVMESATNTVLAKKTATSKKQAKSIQVKSPFSAKDKKVTTTLTLKKGSTFKIKTAVSPKSAGKKLVYKSSKKKVATVSKSGKIKAKKVGKTKITIYTKSNKKVKAVIKVTVVKKLKKVKKIALNKSSLSLSVNGNNRSAQLTASVVSPKKPTVKKFNWFTSNKKVATVSKKGVVTAKKEGNAKITVTSADGRGAKAVCKVTVTKGTNPNPPAPSKTPSVTAGVNPSGSPAGPSGSPSDSPVGPTGANPSASPSPTPAKELTVATNRTGIKQGESLQLKAEGPGADKVSWSVSELAGVTLSASGLLSVASTAGKGKSFTVTATTSADVKVKTATKVLTVVEDINEPMADDDIQINVDTKANPYGLTYRSDNACSEYEDAERGDVIRFDAREGYTASANDMLAWLVVDPAYAGKTVTISGYLKYEAQEGDLTDGMMNLIINENWGHSNPAYKYNAKPGEWHRVKGTYKMTSDPGGFNGSKNRFYIARSADHLNSGKNVVYYLDDLRFTVKKAVVESVTLSTKNDVESLYQNHTLQFTSEVIGTNGPSQETKYEIVPAVAGASINDDGLLTVGKVAAGTTITVKATSVEDASKSATKTVTVLAQTVDEVTVAPEKTPAPTEIYAGQPVQFKADVATTGEADSSVTWSVSPETTGVSITQDGLLSVTDAVADNTKLTVKAVSKFDAKQSGTYEITVRENKITNVTISSMGNKNTVSSDSPLTLSVRVDTIGSFSGKVKWTFKQDVTGAKLSSEDGTTTVLSVSSNVAEGTAIVVCATSVEDTSKSATITITVASKSDGFDINKLKVETWSDFNEAAGPDDVDAEMERIGVSGKVTAPTKPTGWKRLFNTHMASGAGLIDTADSGGGIALNYAMATADDYLEFTIDNTEKEETTYQLSFMARLGAIADEKGESDYQLPLEMILVKSGGAEEKIKDNIKLPYRCNPTYEMYDVGYQEIICEVKVPENQKINLRLKLKEGEELPGCIKDNCSYADVGHPFKLTIDNIAISSGTTSTLNMKVGEEYSLSLDTLDDDSVMYYTNSCLIKNTHDNSFGEGGTTCACHKFDNVVASVDEDGKITAETAGDTALIAVITHSDGSVERRQCIVHVEAK